MNRGVFKPIPKEEADRYKGAVNYISMVEAGIQDWSVCHHPT